MGKVSQLTPIENLRGFASGRPPMVIFMLCLGLFAVVLVSVAYYIKMHDIRNPDITQDWNVFLENFADLEFCITGNYSDPLPISTETSLTRSLRSKRTTTISPNPSSTSADGDGLRNYSVSLLLTITPTREFSRIPHNLTHISGTIYGRQIGLKGDAGDELINMTAQLPYEWNSTECSKGNGCDPVQIYTCVMFSAPPAMFPTSRSPHACYEMNETGVEYHARIMAHKHKSMFQTYWCRQRPTIRVHYNFNPSLTVWLSMHDRSVINLHLMHTSYFLFVMVVTLFCYALIKGRPNKHIQAPDKINNHA